MRLLPLRGWHYTNTSKTIFEYKNSHGLVSIQTLVNGQQTTLLKFSIILKLKEEEQFLHFYIFNCAAITEDAKTETLDAAENVSREQVI